MNAIPLLMLILVAFLILLIPGVIIVLGKRRPVISFIAAAIALMVILIAPPLIKTFQAMMIYGTGDPQLMAGGISEAIANTGLGLIVFLPLLFLFQFFVRRKYKRDDEKRARDETFL